MEYPKHFVTAVGLVSTVGDMLRFSMALDTDELVGFETRRMAFSPVSTSKGKVLPYRMGWFVQQRRGVKVLWHYGWDRANSTLIIRKRSTAKFDLGHDGDVTRSPFAREFLQSMGL